MNAGRTLRAVVALAALAVVFFTVLNWWGDYRASKPGGNPGETTSTAGTTETAGAQGEVQEGEGATAGSSGVIVLVDGLNFRKEPSAGADLIRTLDEGTRLKHLETSNGWYKVEEADGTVGWVSASTDYTRLEE